MFSSRYAEFTTHDTGDTNVQETVTQDDDLRHLIWKIVNANSLIFPESIKIFEAV